MEQNSTGEGINPRSFHKDYFFDEEDVRQYPCNRKCEGNKDGFCIYGEYVGEIARTKE